MLRYGLLKLREMIEYLIYKIEYDKESLNEQVRKVLDRFHVE